MKPFILLLLLILTATMILIPVIFVTFFNSDSVTLNAKDIALEVDPANNVPVKVYRTQLKKVETYPLEEYVRGVVAAEMPVNFELEALKAQALAARTYIVKRIIEKDFSGVPDGGMVTDTVQHQVFLSEEDLKRRWGLEYTEKVSKLNKAINETRGQVITYNGKPITALFFSTSNGYTENSEDYYQQEVPYLRSVESKWDIVSPKYESSTFVPFSKLSASLQIDTAVMTSSNTDWINILEMTDGKRIKKIKIGNKVLTGREVREALGLNSSSFTLKIQKDGLLFQTKGYGHGVGMSQYGANGMAQEGKKAEEIVAYYYTGVQLTNIKDWIKPVKN